MSHTQVLDWPQIATFYSFVVATEKHPPMALQFAPYKAAKAASVVVSLKVRCKTCFMKAANIRFSFTTVW